MAPGRRKGGGRGKAMDQLHLGDLVLAKVKGFPAWPAKVSWASWLDYDFVSVVGIFVSVQFSFLSFPLLVSRFRYRLLGFYRKYETRHLGF